ncbi:hypothetical protein IEO21_08723 [Rhodonia placenta]|uniref:Uncharacterized protein n=1 Tax=Rhodonia placenta TaxID=104341 RepID=A0A8H7TYF7_9APHY|nr:hypothetical protein IEO21_08723 [Postia placenta]
MATQPGTTASSSATLVDHFRLPPNAAASPNSPPNTVTATNADLWTQHLSTSFGTIADQITAASHALAAVEVPAGTPAVLPTDSTTAIAALASRLDAIERTQEHLAEELDAVRAHMGKADNAPSTNGALAVEEEPRAPGTGAPEAEPTDLAKTVEELQKKVDKLAEMFRGGTRALTVFPRCSQSRLYARLRNAVIPINKTPISPLVMANGKTPANFPGTKGEFERMTKERYEHLLKSYDQPVKGDTAAKRQAAREFLGLPPVF